METDATTSAARTTDTATDGIPPAEMAARTGVSIDTLRYYEREGLIDPIARSSSGHRRYGIADVIWIETLRCLRETGMTIEQLRHYCSLGRQGSVTEPERLALLTAHRAAIEEQISVRREALRLIDHKIGMYGVTGE